VAETVAPSCASPYRCLSSLAAQTSQCGPFQFSCAEIRFDVSNKPVFSSVGNPMSSAHVDQTAKQDEMYTTQRPIVSVWSLFELVKLASRLDIRSSGMLHSALWLLVTYVSGQQISPTYRRTLKDFLHPKLRDVFFPFQPLWMYWENHKHGLALRRAWGTSQVPLNTVSFIDATFFYSTP
jgi:hypothetical protein